MLKLEEKKKKSKKKQDVKTCVDERGGCKREIIEENGAVLEIVEVPKKQEKEDELADFYHLAALLDTPFEQLKESFFLYEIRNLMAKIKKVLVRYDVPEAELQEIFLSANYLHMGGLIVAPIYLPACAKQSKKHDLFDVSVGSVIDFPFGESSFKGKLSDVKESIKIGADEITVSIPSMLLSEDGLKEFKKQIKKLGRAFPHTGVALNASDLDEDKIKQAIKLINKTKLSFITFAFGEATLEEVKAKMEVINKHRQDKKIFVLANVDCAEAVMELIKLNVDKVLTPYADAIGADLLKRFKVKSAKAV